MMERLLYLLVIWCARVLVANCDYTSDDLLKLKREIFEKLTSIADTVLEFTNSAEEEKDQIRSILQELAIRHDQDDSKMKEKLQIQESSTIEVKDATGPYVIAAKNGKQNHEDVTTGHDDVTTGHDDVTERPQRTTRISSVTKPIVRVVTLETKTNTCRMYGESCSTQNTEVCCEQLYCKRNPNNLGSTRGKCRFI